MLYMMKLATFDIFDTTLIRRCGSPETVFELTGRRLFPDDESMKNAFVVWRKRCTADSISEIYQGNVCPFTSWHSSEAMAEAERDVEADLLTFNPAVRQLIEEKRKNGFKIAFISDMHLDSKFLKSILLREGCAKEEDRVYVSCECSARKDTGSLYDIVRVALHPKQWEHYGDNRRSDFKTPRKKGIKAYLVITRFSPVETATLQIKCNLQRYFEINVLTGLSRLHRLKNCDDSYAAMAADFVAPTYLPYVTFVLQEAKRRNIKRLYFLNRDGYVLMKAAQAMLPLSEDIELRYLFVSRRSLLLPYLHQEGRETYLDACDSHSIIGIDSIEKRLQHVSTNRKELESQYGISFDFETANNLQQQDYFLTALFNSAFTEELQRRSAEAFDLTTAYFAQEGLMDGTKSAIVDVGWLGTTRLMLNRILAKCGIDEIEFFYYGIRGDVLSPSAGRYTSYQYEGLSIGITGLIENYYSASPYPTVIAYKRDNDGKIAPVFPDNAKRSPDRIVKTNVNAVEAIGREMVHYNLTDQHVLDLWGKQAIKIITTGNIRFNLDPLLACSDFDNNPFVKRLSWFELIRFLFAGATITIFDRASFNATVPHSLQKALWQLHRFTNNIRCRLYRKLHNAKQPN